MLPHLGIDAPLQQLVLGKTEGVPFFIEEFVKSLLDLDVVERAAGKMSFKGNPPEHCRCHALTREVVHTSIMSDRKRQLHHRIGTAMEEIHKEDLSEHYEILSEHFYQSEAHTKAAAYAKKAARKAEKSASIPDAIVHMQKRITCLEKLPASEDNARSRIDARASLGLYLAQSNHWAEAWEVVEPVEGICNVGVVNRIAANWIEPPGSPLNIRARAK